MTTTEMVKEKKQTEMTNAPKKSTKMVMVYCLRPFQLGGVEFGPGGKVVADTTRTVMPKEIVSVPEDKARELCERINGAYAFSGERYHADGDIERHNLARARLATRRDIDGDKEEEILEGA